MKEQVKQDSPKAWLLAARPKTLTGAAVPVLIGLALAYTDVPTYSNAAFSWTAAALCMLFALLMQIDANFINDFFDYTNGNDDTERRLGPLRACTQGWVKLDSMKRAIAGTTCAACVMGLPLIYYGGLEMIAIGLLCVVFCFLYTTHLSYVGMGDVLVVVFFGIVPVTTTYYIQLHTCTWQVFTCSVACGLVIDTLLVVNNYRDRNNDRMDGKRTLVVKMGARWAEWFYLALGVLAVLMGGVCWLYGHVLAFVLPFLYLPFHVFTWLKMRRIRSGRSLNICLGETARNMLIYGVCLSLGLLLL